MCLGARLRVFNGTTCKTLSNSHVNLSSKAIYPVLKTEGFLNAFKRFTFSGGLCNEICSDNGTNFVGAQ